MDKKNNMEIWSLIGKVYKLLLVVLLVNVLPTEPLKLTVSNECIERCSSRISWRWRSWCSNNCPLIQPSSKFGSTVLYPPHWRATTIRQRRNSFERIPSWEKVTEYPGPRNTFATVKTTLTTQKPILKTWTTTTTTAKTTTSTTVETTTTTSAAKTTTTETTRNILKTKTYKYPDLSETRSAHELESVVQKNIDTQNVLFKVAGGLLGLCLVVFVVFFVLRSVKKPHRVSFTDEPVIIVHTSYNS